MTKALRITVLALLFAAPALLFAQGERKDKQAVTYEELYDEPYSINKLFVHFQPLYGELFVTNVNAGYGAEVSYYMRDKADFRAHMRKTYSQRFFDFSRDLAAKNTSVDNRTEVYNYYELGGTYHIKDFEKSSKTKMVLYKKSYAGNKWAARVPLFAEVPCKVRIVYGGRAGAILWNSSTDLDRAMVDQGILHTDLKNIDPDSEYPNIPFKEAYQNSSGQVNEVDVNLYTNVQSIAAYVGGSYSWIRNVAVNFDKYEEGVDDLILTAYADIFFAPQISLDNIVYTYKDDNGARDIASTGTYSVSPIKTQPLGFRIGVEGKYNRMFGWAYGAEIGSRPSIQGRGFYTMLKISFPVFGTQLDYKVESFGK